jgi:hypothetical protein
VEISVRLDFYQALETTAKNDVGKKTCPSEMVNHHQKGRNMFFNFQVCETDHAEKFIPFCDVHVRTTFLGNKNLWLHTYVSSSEPEEPSLDLEGSVEHYGALRTTAGFVKSMVQSCRTFFNNVI